MGLKIDLKSIQINKILINKTKKKKFCTQCRQNEELNFILLLIQILKTTRHFLEWNVFEVN